MEKIKLIADATCDMDLELAKKLDIDIVPVNVIVDGKNYLSEIEISTSEIYDIVDSEPQRLTTAHPTPEQFINSFKKAAADGYTAIVVVVINAAAAGTEQCVKLSRELFYEETGRTDIRIEVFNSGSYSMLFGTCVLNMRELIDKGKSVEELLEYAKYFCDRISGFGVVGTLDHLKKTGRVSGAAGFIGNVLDLKPILFAGDRDVKAYGKIRGRKNSIPKIIELTKEMVDPDCKDFVVFGGRNDAEMAELADACEAAFNVRPKYISHIGCALAINVGTDLILLGFLKKL
ncbi:MAG: DegV family protein [Bacillota bacterium]|nr:DegV family protein [Bacillota bacterium]